MIADDYTPKEFGFGNSEGGFDGEIRIPGAADGNIRGEKRKSKFENRKRP